MKKNPVMVIMAVLVLAMLASATATLAKKPAPTPTPTPTPSASPSATPQPTPAPTPTGSVEEQLMDAVHSLSKVQTLCEFYYMSTGQYPGTLQELDAQYNEKVPSGTKRVDIPLDPATGKPFLYEPSADGMSYMLRVPLPEKYGVKKLEIANVDWGWMNGLAAQHKKEQQAQLCGLYVRGLAQALDGYAREHKNELPDTLDALITAKLVKKIPVCPACGKPYLYTKSARGFEIACPDPKSHDMEMLKFSSTEGFKTR